MTDLAKLIEDLEGAKSGSQELDARVAIALGWTANQAGIWLKPDGERMFWPEDTIPPSFTTNLQDAVDAVPEGCSFCLEHWPDWNMERADVVVPGRKPPKSSYAKTLPLALCIAILRAKAAERD